MKILLVANTDWYLYNYRLALARQLRDEGWEVLLASPGGQYVPRMRENGFRWAPISVSRRGLLPHQELGSIVDLLRLYRRETPDLLHHFTMKPVLYGSIAARWAGCEAIVNSIAGLGYLFLTDRQHIRLIRTLLSPIFRYALSGDDVRVIFENEGDRAYFVGKGFIDDWQATIVQGVGVNLDRFQASDEPGGDVSVLMASRLLWDKGVGEFIEAARMIATRYPAVRFILVGGSDPGNPSNIDESLVKEWVAQGITEWWGHRKDIRKCMPKCISSCCPLMGRVSQQSFLKRLLVRGQSWPAIFQAVELWCEKERQGSWFRSETPARWHTPSKY